MPIEIAKEWNTYPWKLVGGSRLLWYVRFEVLRGARMKMVAKQKRDMEKVRTKK